MPVPSPENPLLPEESGWDYSTVLPLARRTEQVQSTLGLDESGKPQMFTPPGRAFALPGIIRASINELTNAATLPGRVAQGQVAPQALPQQAIGASLALMGAGAGVAPSGAGVMGTARGLGGKLYHLEPVDHDPFAGQDIFKPSAVPGPGQPPIAPGTYTGGGPAKVATQHAEQMYDLTMRAMMDAWEAKNPLGTLSPKITRDQMELLNSLGSSSYPVGPFGRRLSDAEFASQKAASKPSAGRKIK